MQYFGFSAVYINRRTIPNKSKPKIKRYEETIIYDEYAFPVILWYDGMQ